MSGTIQVENNTIAASFGCLSTRVAAMHAYLVEHFMDHPKIVSAFPRKTDEERKNNSEVGFPKNAAISNFAEAIAEAIRSGSIVTPAYKRIKVFTQGIQAKRENRKISKCFRPDGCPGRGGKHGGSEAPRVFLPGEMDVRIREHDLFL